MNEFIKVLSNEIIKYKIAGGIGDENKLVSKIRDHLDEITSGKDKVELLAAILEANDLEYKHHLKSCKNIESCGTNKKHIKTNYFLQQELEEIGVISTDNFTREEKEKYNEKLDEILQTILNANEIVSEQIEEIKAEIEELKHLYILGKKNWKQQFAGKLTSLVASGVITEVTAKPIIEGVLKPSATFILERI